ncbi:hypothetical protein V6Z11_D02G191800 [Gossypium hirsutum]
MNKASTSTSIYKGVITHFNPTFESPEEVLLDQKLVTYAQKINQWREAMVELISSQLECETRKDMLEGKTS